MFNGNIWSSIIGRKLRVPCGQLVGNLLPKSGCPQDLCGQCGQWDYTNLLSLVTPHNQGIEAVDIQIT